ncbi:Hsp20/alpha crystallin family protein [Hymenobacter busanensis]|nr:Hsp20/alpha crystallin family protein [Hymenobacter busanensis]QHJ08337.1 Hsp20 family protein [Hymenobacter busanensis]
MNLISRNTIRNFLPQLDLLNTLGGGVAQPKLNLEKQARGVVISVALPTVDSERFHVVLDNNRLTVYAEFRHEPEAALAAPLFVHTFELPPALDLHRIDAVHENGELKVRIPFENPTDRRREIDIKRR